LCCVDIVNLLANNEITYLNIHCMSIKKIACQTLHEKLNLPIGKYPYSKYNSLSASN